jgi:hypothetical protein
MAEPGEEHSVARVKPAASKSQGKPKTERRQQQKHKKNVALHQICVKSEWVRRQEWILREGVNEVAAKKKENKKKGERPRVAEGEDRAGTVALTPSA